LGGGGSIWTQSPGTLSGFPHAGSLSPGGRREGRSLPGGWSCGLVYGWLWRGEAKDRAMPEPLGMGNAIPNWTAAANLLLTSV